MEKQSGMICADNYNLIHKILSFAYVDEAVETCVLSKAGSLFGLLSLFSILTWTRRTSTIIILPPIFLSNRNHQTNICKLKFSVSNYDASKSSANKLVEYAIEHNVYLNLSLLFCYHDPFKLSTFSSNSLKKLTLRRIRLADSESESDCCDLPALTSLYLTPRFTVLRDTFFKFPRSCLTGLPALTTLYLRDWDLSVSSFSFILPKLTMLSLNCCKLPQTSWDLPALLSLDFLNVQLPDNMSDIFSKLVNLRNLTLTGCSMQQDHFICCPRLEYLTIPVSCYMSHCIVVLAPKLSKFCSVGIFPITFGAPEQLKKVDMKLEIFGSVYNENKKIFHPQFTSMLLGFGNASYIMFDLGSFHALSDISNLLVSLPSPFYNLMYMKLPRGYEESGIPSALKSFLLGASPRATIVT